MKKKLLLIMSIMCLSVGLLSCGNTANDKQSENTQDNAAINKNKPSKQEDKLLNLNEEGNLKDWSVVVTNVEILDTIIADEYFAYNADEGNKYLKVDCTVTNNGKKANNFLSSITLNDDVSAKLLYQTDYEYSATYLISHRDDLHDSVINPLANKSGIIVFSIPESVASSNEELILIFKVGNESIKFKVK